MQLPLQFLYALCALLVEDTNTYYLQYTIKVKKQSNNSRKLPTISIVVPVYNEQHYISRCLAAIDSQVLQPQEIIIVDNNCSDDTIAIASKHPLVRVVPEPKQGIAYARSTGFNAAKYDIIAKLDADSRPNADWLEQYQTALMDCDAVSCRIYTYEGSLRWLTSWSFNTMTFFINKLLSGHHMLFGSNYAMHASVWQRIKNDVSNDPSLWEDLNAAQVVAEHSFTIGHLPKRLVGISVRGADISAWRFAMRLVAWTRTYWLHNKLAACLSVGPVIVSIVCALMVRPFAAIGYQRER